MFKVGDKVSLNKGISIGTVIRLTDKKQDVVVDFGNFCQKFSQTGRSIGGDRWNFDYIYPLTDELKRKIVDERAVVKCQKLLSDIRNYGITPDKARKIIAFFEQEILNE